MEITTNVGCRNACAYCPQGTIVKAYAERQGECQMSLDAFRFCLDKIPRHVDITFSGMSEPWLNPQCTDMILHASRKGYAIRVFTSLVGMSASDVDQLQNALLPFKAFVVHLPSAEGYERIPVDGTYIDLVRQLIASSFPTTWLCFGTVHPAVKQLVGDALIKRRLSSRAGNLKTENRTAAQKRRGTIRCARRLPHNVLMPNGDVLLCCMDYGMKHILGNLLTSDYQALFEGREFLTVKRGLREPSSNILCRQCDLFAQDVNLTAKFFNSFLFDFKRVRSVRDVPGFIQRGFVGLKEHFLPRERVYKGINGGAGERPEVIDKEENPQLIE